MLDNQVILSGILPDNRFPYRFFSNEFKKRFPSTYLSRLLYNLGVLSDGHERYLITIFAESRLQVTISPKLTCMKEVTVRTLSCSIRPQVAVTNYGPIEMELLVDGVLVEKVSGGTLSITPSMNYHVYDDPKQFTVVCSLLARKQTQLSFPSTVSSYKSSGKLFFLAQFPQ